MAKPLRATPGHQLVANMFLCAHNFKNANAQQIWCGGGRRPVAARRSTISQNVVFEIPIKFRPAYNASQGVTLGAFGKFIQIWSFVHFFAIFGHFGHFGHFWPFWHFFSIYSLWKYCKRVGILSEFFRGCPAHRSRNNSDPLTIFSKSEKAAGMPKWPKWPKWPKMAKMAQIGPNWPKCPKLAKMTQIGQKCISLGCIVSGSEFYRNFKNDVLWYGERRHYLTPKSAFRILKPPHASFAHFCKFPKIPEKRHQL